ncbi:hypothetical protein GGI17_003726 [Coemansia sp. S146]|nr:hypothetical protein GGI17_003726 [Coemansia sp. S146]
MSHFTRPTLKSPPSRRGTPSSNDPIPFFNGQGVVSGGSNNSAAAAAAAASNSFYPSLSFQSEYQRAPAGMPNYQQQQWPSAQHGVPSGQYQQPTYGQTSQREVPPRCATGPAVENPYQRYEYAYNAAPVAAPGMDPYRSASVVHSGTQYSTSFGYKATQVNGVADLAQPDGATFFDQLAATVEPSLISNAHMTSDVSSVVDPASGYYAAQYAEQPASISASGVVDLYDTGATLAGAAYSAEVSVSAANNSASEGTAQSGVVYDQSVGQYYDTNSGQYYDNSTGAWYYPQTISTNVVDAYTHSTAVVPEAADSHTTAPEPISVSDGAAFFDNLGATQTDGSYSAAPQVPSLPDDGSKLSTAATNESLYQVSTEQLTRESPTSYRDVSAPASAAEPSSPDRHASIEAAEQRELEHGYDNALSSAQRVSPAIGASTAGIAPVQDYQLGGKAESTTDTPTDDIANSAGPVVNQEAYGHLLPIETPIVPEAACQMSTDQDHEHSATQASFDILDQGNSPVGEANSVEAPAEAILADIIGNASSSPPDNVAAFVTASETTDTVAAITEVTLATFTHDHGSFAQSEDMDSSESTSQPRRIARPLSDLPLSSHSLEPDLPPAHAADEQALPQEFGYPESGATSETMGRSIAAVSRPSLPTPSLSTNWSLQAEHDSASSVVDTAVETHISDAVTASATEGSQTNDVPVADSFVTSYNDSSSFYYSQQYNPYQVSAAATASVATAEVGYESLDAQFTQDDHGVVGTEYIAEYPGYGGAAVYGETFASDGAPTTENQFQSFTTNVAYSDNAAYANYDPYTREYTGAYASNTADHVGNEFELNTYHSDQGTFIEPHAPSEHYGGDTYMAYEDVSSNGYQADVHYDTAVSAPYGEPIEATRDLSQHAYRAASSLSGPALPPPPMVFDFQSHSERTSTDMSFYDRDAPLAAAATATANVAVADTGEYEQQLGAGVHDPLGRLSACRPVVSFGFGGRLVTMFPRQVQRFNIYDSGKASKVAAGILQVRQLADYIPTDHFVHSTPLLTGETSRGALLKRRDVAVACAKTWITSALQAGLVSQEERVLCDVLVAVLSAFGAADVPQFEFSAALEALQPLIAEGARATNSASLADMPPPISHGSKEQLDGLEGLLLKGKRMDAIDMACAQGLWTHALIIASCTGKQHWQSVVSAYTSSVLQSGHSTLGIQYRMFSGLGADSLDEPRRRYASEALVNSDGEFVTAADIGGAKARVNGHSEHAGGDSSSHATADWARILSLILANRTPGDQAAILKLGDRLRDSGQALAAHICYVLTLQSKDVFLPESPEAQPRAILLGTSEIVRSRTSNSAFEMPLTRYSHFYRKSSAIFLTELYEVAFALKTAAASDVQLASTSTGVPSGSGAAAAGSGASSAGGARPTVLMCLPHLQAYKLHQAWWLVDCGQAALASRYCDSVLGILATLPQGVPVPFIHTSLVQELRNLRDRLSGSGMTSIKAAEIVGDDAAVSGAGSKSWLARAMPRPSFTSFMSAFDSSIDKFITGADGNRISLESSLVPGKYEVGPDRTPQQGRESERSAGPSRPLGAVSWEGRTPSPRVLPANVTNGYGETTRYSDAYVPAFGSPRQSLDGRPSGLGTRDGSVSGRGSVPPRMYTPSNSALSADQVARDFSQQTTQPISQPQWGDPSNGHYGVHQNEYAAPRASFGDGSRVSMSSMGYGGEVAGSNAEPPAHSRPEITNDDEEDMFGFSRKQPSVKPGQGSARPSTDVVRGTTTAASSARPSADASDEKASGKGDAQTDAKGGNGVLGILKSIWGGRKNQANLGEESHFVYDPVQKRWVDKNASAEQQDVGPPPPPPPSAMRFQPQSSSVPPPASMGVHSHGLSGIAYGAAATTGSSPLGMNGHAPPPPFHSSIGDRPHSEIPPVAASADLSRVGSPASSLGAMGASSTPPASSGGRGGKRRAARTKYVDLLNQ